MLITFEGCNGVGKTTQMNIMLEYLLKDRGVKVLSSNCFYDKSSYRIHQIIEDDFFTPFSETLIYTGLLIKQLEERIIPLLRDGYIVLCDRYIDSTLAYQGYGQSYGIKKLEDLFSLVGMQIPDLTFILDDTFQNCIKRRSVSKYDQGTFINNEIFEKVRNGYLEIAVKERCFLIDANREAIKVHEDMKAILLDFLK